jgi:methylmalonyl-CoA mutase N-terminal domain/subunit
VIVGVNRFQTQEAPPQGLLKVDPKVREVQMKRLAELKASRNSQGAKTSLEELEKVARGDGNLMAPILNCVRAYCTLGEICDALRSVFGEYESAVKV